MPTRDVTTFIDNLRTIKVVVTNMLNDKTSNGRLVSRIRNDNYGVAEFKFIA